MWWVYIAKVGGIAASTERNHVAALATRDVALNRACTRLHCFLVCMFRVLRVFVLAIAYFQDRA